VFSTGIVGMQHAVAEWANFEITRVVYYPVLWKAFRKKDIVLFGFSKKKLFGTLLPLLNKPIGFITKLEKQFKDSP